MEGHQGEGEVGAVSANDTDQKQRNLTGDSCHPSVLEHGPRTKKCVTRDTYGTADQRGAERSDKSIDKTHARQRANNPESAPPHPFAKTSSKNYHSRLGHRVAQQMF